MANVRYMGGGTSATLGTKDITENGTYNAVNDDLDGYSSVTVDVPEPTGTVSLSYNANGNYDVDVKDYADADITVNVPEPVTQTKTITATTSQQVVTPDAGKLLSEVVVNPQQNAGTYTPAPNTAANDMGPVNSYRYVNTSGMFQPTGTKSVSYTSNGEYTESVTSYSNIDIEIDVPVSGTLESKSIIANGTYTALDDDLDGYSSVNVNVPQNATLGIKSVTSNGEYYATSDGYDGYSRVNVNVAGGTLQSNKTVTATTSQQVVQPDSGYDGLEQVTVNPQVHTQTYTPAANTAANDMGAQNDYRYVNTSGMVVPSSITPSNSNPAALTSGSAVTPSANGYAIASYYGNVAPDNSYPVPLIAGEIYQMSNSSAGDGYAIESYDSVTPSSTPRSVFSNNMILLRGNGVIVDSVPTPTSITPSNSSPVALTADTPVNPTASGYAISSYSSITPSDSSPVTLSSGSIYKMSGAGKAVASVTSKTPSDSSPASVSANSIIKPSSAGYLYASSGLGKCKSGTISASAGNVVTLNCGFQPKKICIYAYGSANSYYNGTYDSDVDGEYYRAGWRTSSSSTSANRYAIGGTSNGCITEINSTGFKWRGSSNFTSLYYFAIG